MRKKLLIALSILVLSSAVGTAYSKTASSTELTNAIKLYKVGNYTECHAKLESIVKKDSSNALAYYYMAMTSAQLGRRQEALDNYNKTITLSNPSSNVYRYASKGKTCIEMPEKCQSAAFDSPIEKLLNTRKSNLTDEVRSDFEKLKIENMMREINRSEDIDPQRFREYRDFSSFNTEGSPSNDEIVAAIKTLQKAGIYNFNNNGYSDLSMFAGVGNNPMFMQGNSNLSPQVIQAMLTNNMSLGF